MSGESWLKSADRALSLAAGQIQLIRAVTPANAESELALLERAFRRGSPRPPSWIYDGSAASPELCLALEKLASFLDGISALGAVYAARARELLVEAAIIDAVGTARLRTRAEERFIPRTEQGLQDLAQADDLAAAWTLSGSGSNERLTDEDRVKSCDIYNPSSLVSRMSCEAGRQRLAVRVVLQPGLASLAATGDGVILVAPAKWVARRDVERTVLHEIAGHALPRARAGAEELGIFALGTAQGIDDQEGRALLIEESAGFLDAGRRRELGLRHLAARATLEGQCFIDVVGLLLNRAATVQEAVRIAARVQRGGQGSGGLAREVVYLPAYLRVRRALGGPLAAVIERVMASGRIAVDVAPLLAKAAKRAIERTSGPEKGSVFDLRG
jgi:hypothetical protein